MNRRTIIIVSLSAGVLLLGLIWLFSGSSPDTVPGSAVIIARPAPSTTQPNSDNPTAAFTHPDEYAIFQSRNPFTRGPGAARKPGAESSLVFKGAIRDGSTFTALIEDTAVKQITRGVVGDKLARGKIASIDLDGLVYAANGNSRRILVGQNLEGTLVPPTPPPPPQQMPKPPGPDQQQQGPNGPSGPPGPGAMPPGFGGPQQGASPPNRGPSEG